MNRKIDKEKIAFAKSMLRRLMLWSELYSFEIIEKHEEILSSERDKEVFLLH